jgi:hypothetical protein
VLVCAGTGAATDWLRAGLATTRVTIAEHAVARMTDVKGIFMIFLLYSYANMLR